MSSSDEPRDFQVSEEMLSGFVDGVLVQQEEQRVRLYLERSAEARRLVRELREMRDAARSTPFAPPDDGQWSERPRTRLSGVLRGGGWTVLVLWAIGLSAYAVVELLRSSESLVEKLIAVGGISGLAVLLVSVAVDRWKVLATDRYRGVEK